MRRQLMLMGLIAAVLVSLYVIMSNRPTPKNRAASPASAETGDPAESFPLFSPIEPEYSSQPPAPAPAEEAQVSSPLPVKGPPYRTATTPKRYLVSVSDENGRPVEKAVIIVFRSKDVWTTYDKNEGHTDREGKTEVVKEWREQVTLHVYKPGIGHATWHELEHSGPANAMDPSLIDAPVILRPHPPMKIRVTGPYGNLRGGAAVTVSAELNIGSRDKETIWLKLPPRSVKADELGRCEIEGLPNHGPVSSSRIRSSGCRFAITATWENRTTDAKIDGFPAKEIQIFIE